MTTPKHKEIFEDINELCDFIQDFYASDDSFGELLNIEDDDEVSLENWAHGVLYGRFANDYKISAT